MQITTDDSPKCLTSKTAKTDSSDDQNKCDSNGSDDDGDDNDQNGSFGSDDGDENDDGDDNDYDGGGDDNGDDYNNDEDDDDDDDENRDEADENDDDGSDNDGPNLARSRTKSLTDALSKSLTLQLIKEGFKNHLQNTCGSTTKSKAIHQIIRQVAVFLSWIEQSRPQSDKQYTRWRVSRKLCFVLKNDFKSIFAFQSHLTGRDCKPMTCNSYGSSIANSLQWLKLDFSSKYGFDHSPVETVLKMCRRKYRRDNEFRQMTLSDTNTMVEDRLWPAEGLPDLQKPVEDIMPWVESLVIIYVTCISHLITIFFDFV